MSHGVGTSDKVKIADGASLHPPATTTGNANRAALRTEDAPTLAVLVDIRDTLHRLEKLFIAIASQ